MTSKPLSSLTPHNEKGISSINQKKPSREDAEQAVVTLLKWIGENPEREGLRDTPARFTKAWEEHFSGYHKDPKAELSKFFEDIEGYDDIILLKGIRFHSFCEHHIHPITGKASIAYWPDKRIVGISKLARVIDIFAKRLISQEMMTQNIVDAIQDSLLPKGVAIQIEAEHTCMSTRGVSKEDVLTVTNAFTGVFREPDKQNRFLAQIA